MTTYTIPNWLILDDEDAHRIGEDWSICCVDGKHFISIPYESMDYNSIGGKSEISIIKYHFVNEYDLKLYGVDKDDLSHYQVKYATIRVGECLGRLTSLSEKETKKLRAVCGKARKKKNIVDINFPNEYVKLNTYDTFCTIDIADWDGEKVSLFIAEEIMKIVKTDYGWVYSVPMALDADRDVCFESYGVHGSVPVKRIKEFADELVECAKTKYCNEDDADDKAEWENDWISAALAEIEENERMTEVQKKEEEQDPEVEAATDEAREETREGDEGDE